MDQTAARATSHLGQTLCAGHESRPTTGAFARSGRGRGAGRKVSPEALVVGGMALEGTIIGYSGVLTLWLQKEEVTQAAAGLVSHCSAVLLVSGLAVLALNSGGAYRITGRRPAECIKRAALVWLPLACTLLIAAAALDLHRHFAVRWAALWLAFVTVGLIVERCLIALWLLQLKEKPLAWHRVVIMPASKASLLLEQRLLTSAEIGLHVVGFVDDRSTQALPGSFPRERVIGDTGALIRMIRAGEVDEIVIAMPWTARKAIQSFLAVLSELPVRVSLATGPLAGDPQMQCLAALGGEPVLRLSDRPFRGLRQVVKMLEDVILASLILIPAMPLMVLVAIAIKLDSSGPVLFCQPRIGFNGRPFTVFKFRTMHVDATDVAGRYQVTRNDTRVTRVGAWLRRTSIDELPQLLNVLRGEMSLVGPRPHAPGTMVEGRHFHEAVRRYAARHRVKPGLTGWAQVNGWRGETDLVVKLEERLRHDLYYIDNWSFWLDCLILARTLVVPFRQRNAY